MNKAVDALYEEMASRHRVRAPCLQIIKITEVADKDVKRDNTIQFLGVKEPVSSPGGEQGAPLRLQVPEDHLKAVAPTSPPSKGLRQRRWVACASAAASGRCLRWGGGLTTAVVWGLASLASARERETGKREI